MKGLQLQCRREPSGSLVVPLLLLLLTGCGALEQAYPGPPRRAAETAQLYGHGVTLRSVNGRPISLSSTGAAVLAGANRLVVSVDAQNYSELDLYPSEIVIELLAEGGQAYSITSRRGEGRLCAFPIDASSGHPDFSRPAGCAQRE